ncbi:radical SAM-linked protein [Clostridium perfringens]|nr:radical SAM-linked protein [Clostridium perfringens]
MRYLIKFTKDADIKFVSHLDLMRTIQRIVRRAELPVEYSKGFNPSYGLSNSTTFISWCIF